MHIVAFTEANKTSRYEKKLMMLDTAFRQTSMTTVALKVPRDIYLVSYFNQQKL